MRDSSCHNSIFILRQVFHMNQDFIFFPLVSFRKRGKKIYKKREQYGLDGRRKELFECTKLVNMWSLLSQVSTKYGISSWRNTNDFTAAVACKLCMQGALYPFVKIKLVWQRKYDFREKLSEHSSAKL